MEDSAPLSGEIRGLHCEMREDEKMSSPIFRSSAFMRLSSFGSSDRASGPNGAGHGEYVESHGAGAPVYLAAVLEYLAGFYNSGDFDCFSLNEVVFHEQCVFERLAVADLDWHESSMKSIWDSARQRDFGNWLTGKLFGVNYISL
ncbi:hypothetical protein SADUNF_Sadunf18G0034100 [Salix dunnii]|uniref:Uncharacterized protein n=1 Tax=Salix dunnii TaxID=1413687 RepID=A0A835MDI0_9ROSI|nr:hypothetical protein SADUNF_Sadunf18G0034100 [Salix dunnii]